MKHAKVLNGDLLTPVERSGHRIVVINGCIWLVGGYNPNLERAVIRRYASSVWVIAFVCKEKLEGSRRDTVSATLSLPIFITFVKSQLKHENAANLTHDEKWWKDEAADADGRGGLSVTLISIFSLGRWPTFIQQALFSLHFLINNRIATVSSA